MSRNDNDMYDHMNNSVYSFLYDISLAWSRIQTVPDKVYQI